jgi:hypothetical protein
MGILILSLSRYLSLINFSYNYFLNDQCLQPAYFKCAYECFDRRRSHDDISNCVENCSVPVVRSQQMVENMVENEMAKFQVSYFSFFFFVIPIPIFIQFLVSEQFISREKFV